MPRAFRFLLAAWIVLFAASVPSDALTTGQRAVLFGSNTPAVFTDFTQLGGVLPSSLFTYAGASLRTITDATGAITYAPNNYLLQSNTFSNAVWTSHQVNVTLTGGQPDPFGGNNATLVTATAASALVEQLTSAVSANTIFSLWIRRVSGTGQIGLINAAGGSTNITVTSSWAQYSGVVLNTGNIYSGVKIAVSGDAVQIYGAVRSAVTYETTPRPNDQVITTSAAFYGPAFDFSPTSIGTPLGLRIEEARTNLFLNSAAPVTQTITVASGSAYTISFYGTGVLTLSGALTQVMTGSSAYPARTTYAATTSTTSLVVTVTTLGTLEFPQVELGAFATSYIPTAGASVARAADVVTPIGALAAGLGGASGSLVVKTNDGQTSRAATLVSANGTVMLGETSGNNATTALSSALTSSNTATWTGPNDVGLAWGPATGTIDLNGIATNDNHARTPGSPFSLGSTSGSSAFWDGHLKSIAYYNRQLARPQ